MQLSGSHLIRAGRQDVWSALQDPAVLVRTIPGCLELEEESADTYRARVRAGVASITGVYDGTVALGEQDAPRSYTLRATGQGGPGTIEATATVRLHEADGGTYVEYDADAVVGGAIAGVGQRVLAGVAKRNAAQFFTAVDHHLMAPVGAATGDGAADAAGASPGSGAADAAGPSPGSGAPATAGVATGGVATGGVAMGGVATQEQGASVAAADEPSRRVYRRPAATAATAGGVDARALIGAAVTGAVIALVGVLVGRATVRPVETTGGHRFSWRILSPRVSVRSGPLGT